MLVKLANNVSTTLASGISDSALSLTVMDATGFPALSAGQYFYCTLESASTREVVKVTARASDVLTIVRAQDGTDAHDFSAGAVVEMRLCAAVFSDIDALIRTIEIGSYEGDGNATKVITCSTLSTIDFVIIVGQPGTGFGASGGYIASNMSSGGDFSGVLLWPGADVGLGAISGNTFTVKIHATAAKDFNHLTGGSYLYMAVGKPAT